MAILNRVPYVMVGNVVKNIFRVDWPSQKSEKKGKKGKKATPAGIELTISVVCDVSVTVLFPYLLNLTFNQLKLGK